MVKLYFAVILFIFVSVYLGMHYYVYSRIAGGLMLSRAAAGRLRLTFLIAAFSFVLSEFLSRRLAADWLKPLEYFGIFWLGIISISLSVFIIADTLRLFFYTQQSGYFSVAVSIIAVLLVTAYSVYNVSRGLKTKEIKIKTEKLPAGVRQFSIVQLSDLHIDSMKNLKWLKDIVNKTNALEPDLIVITGDLIDSNVCNLHGYCETLAKLKSKYGVYGVTGNHEYYAGLENFMNIAKVAGIKVLRNEKVTVGGILELAGVNDKEGERFDGGGPDYESALKNCDFKKPVVLLDHRPVSFTKNSDKIDLQLSGHTHAGQIPPMDLFVWLLYKYPFGLHKRNDSHIYTTFGTGTWGPPMRLFSRSEIVKIVLEN